MANRHLQIAVLQDVTHNSPFRYKAFAALAGEMGCTVEYPHLGDGGLEGAQKGWARAEALLRGADALVLAGFPIASVPHLTALFHDRVDAGTRVFAMTLPGNEQDVEDGARLLSRYYMEPSWLKIVDGNGRRLGLKLRAGDDSLRSSELFKDVKEVTVDSPFALRCWGEAFPVMVAGPSAWGVDARTDFPDDWNGRELTCMGQWVGYGDSSVVVASATGIIDDPVDVMAGRLPGIENNQHLAGNLIQFLAKEVPLRRVSSTKPGPEYLCSRIEINLVDFVYGVLKSESKDWWNHFVPLTVRQKASSRQEEEQSRFPKEAYLDILDLKAIMKGHWALFERHFVEANVSGGKDKTLAFVDRVNELRRLTGHPLKIHVSAYVFSSEECIFLENADTLCLTLAAPFMKRRPGREA